MENDCKNRYMDWCRLTAHHHEGDLIAYPCAYPDNCRDCKDYKPNFQRNDPKKSAGSRKWLKNALFIG